MILLGSRIKLMRTAHKFTQTELAEKVGVAKSTIAAYENDTRTPSYDVLIRLSDIFKTSLDYLILERRTDKTIDVSKLTSTQITAVMDIVHCFETDNMNLAAHGHTFNEIHLNELYQNKSHS